MSKDVAVNEARARAGQIRSGAVDYLRTLALIAVAKEARDDITLGYASWEEYVAGEYSALRLRIGEEYRQKAIEELRLTGLSQRAIGGAIGVSAATVNRALRSGVSNETREPDYTSETIDGELLSGDDDSSSSSPPPKRSAPPRTVVQPSREESEPEVETAFDPPEESPRESVRRALDEHVPDPDEPVRKWRIHFLKAIGQGRTPLQFTDDDVAAKVDDECLAELRSFAAAVQSFLDRVEAKRPKPVRSLRVVS